MLPTGVLTHLEFSQTVELDSIMESFSLVLIMTETGESRTLGEQDGENQAS